MQVCRNCGSRIPNRVKLNGNWHTLNHRKFCLSCSPFGLHNTKRSAITIHGGRKCSFCGETNESKFYGKKRNLCMACHNQYSMKKGFEKRDFAISKLGGCCRVCGYNAYRSALHIHHLDPKIKDSKFKSMRSWSIARIEAEIRYCVLLCANCHAAHHNEGLTIPGYKSAADDRFRIAEAAGANPATLTNFIAV